MLNDVRMAVRSLLRAPAFTATTVFTLTIAAAANAAILAIVIGVLLKPLPYDDPGRLVFVWPRQFQSNADLQITRDRGTMFAGVAAIAPGWTMSLTGAGEPAKVTVGRVSGNIFDVLGVQPLLGRTFGEEAARPGGDGVVVLSYRLWSTRFGADPHIVGKTVALDGAPVLVTAVMPRTFDLLALRSDAYTPFAMDERAWYHRLTFSFFVGRLRPGLSLKQADTDYKALVQQLKRERKQAADFGQSARLVDLRTALVGDTRTTLVVLAAGVGLILLIAAANVGTLQLTRAAARRRDLAIRCALGASPRRLLRSQMAENVSVALVSGILGVVVAGFSLPALLAVLPRDTPRVEEIHIDSLIAGIVTAGVIVVSLLVGMAPAIRITRAQTAPLLRTVTSETRSAKRWRASFVTAEVALAVILTIGAGLMLRTLWKLQRVDPGFRAAGLLTLHVQPTGPRYRSVSVADFYERVLERVRAVPGVQAAGAIQHLPFSGFSWTNPVEVDGHVVSPGAALHTVEYRIVTPDYFRAMEQPLLGGRSIERADAARPDVVVVNKAFADRFFGSTARALGRGLRTRGSRGPGPRMTIIGVVGNVRHNALTREAGPEVYTSVGRNTIPAMMLAIRTTGDPRPLVPAVRDGIWSIDRDVPLSDIQMMEAKVVASLGRPRLLFSLLGAFAVVGLLLAVVGVYGVVAYSVAQRWRELAIMVALGAERTRIVGGVVREALLYGLAGLAIGIAGALAASRVMQTVVWGVTPTDPLTYAGIALGTVAIVVTAAIVPARRAARVDPADALKGS